MLQKSFSQNRNSLHQEPNPHFIFLLIYHSTLDLIWIISVSRDIIRFKSLKPF